MTIYSKINTNKAYFEAVSCEQEGKKKGWASNQTQLVFLLYFSDKISNRRHPLEACQKEALVASPYLPWEVEPHRILPYLAWVVPAKQAAATVHTYSANKTPMLLNFYAMTTEPTTENVKQRTKIFIL